jgi:hypothetical protein
MKMLEQIILLEQKVHLLVQKIKSSENPTARIHKKLIQFFRKKNLDCSSN